MAKEVDYQIDDKELIPMAIRELITVQLMHWHETSG